MSKPTTPIINGQTKVRRRPANDLVAANRVEHILLELEIEEADWVLKRAVAMHKHRCELANKPPFVPEDGK